MKPIILITLAAALSCATPAYAQLFPGIPSLQDSHDVRFIPVSSSGGLDGIRASAVAGADASPVDAGTTQFLRPYVIDRGLEWKEIVAVYLDVNGVYWLYFDRDNEDRDERTPNDVQPG